MESKTAKPALSIHTIRMNVLFSTAPRSDQSPALHGESQFAFLDRVAGLYWDQVRDLVEGWLAQYPAVGRQDVRGRLASGDDRQFLSAFWELYLYAIFVRAGFSLTVHPPMPQTTTRPDFKAILGDKTFYIEALVLTGDDVERFSDKRLGIVYDAINKAVHHPEFLLAIEDVTEGVGQPRTQVLCATLNHWLRSLNAITLLDAGVAPQHFPTMPWTEGDWQIVFRAIPVRNNLEGCGQRRIIGIYPIRSRMVNDHVLLLDRIRRKSHKYGSLDKPLIVALNYCRWTSGEDQLKKTLFGYLEFGTPAMCQGVLPSDWPRKLGGLWVTKQGPGHCEVSGVLCAFDIRPSSVAVQEPKIWLNPWATRPLNVDLPLSKNALDLSTGRLIKAPSPTTPRELIGISDHWPVGEPFPEFR